MDKNHQATPNQPVDGGQQFAQKLEDNVDEIKAVDAAGVKIQEEVAKQSPIGEEEAKRLLQEEKRLAELEYDKAHKKSNKTLITVLIVAAVLCLLGGAFAMAVASRNGDETDNPEASQPDGGKDDEHGVMGDDKQDDQVVSLGVNDELVQRLYHEYDLVSDPWSDTMRIYVDQNVKTGQIDEILMANLALGVVPKKESCVGDYYAGENSSLAESGCYDMDAVRGKIKEMFGRDVSYNHDDVIGHARCSMWTYDAINQELYNAMSGCGGQCVPVIRRNLVKAEQKGDQIYLYETAYMESCFGIYHIGTKVEQMGAVSRLELGKPIMESEDMIREDLDLTQYVDQFDEFKWTFTKNSDGNYIFSGLEKVEG